MNQRRRGIRRRRTKRFICLLHRQIWRRIATTPLGLHRGSITIKCQLEKIHLWPRELMKDYQTPAWKVFDYKSEGVLTLSYPFCMRRRWYARKKVSLNQEKKRGCVLKMAAHDVRKWRARKRWRASRVNNFLSPLRRLSHYISTKKISFSLSLLKVLPFISYGFSHGFDQGMVCDNCHFITFPREWVWTFFFCSSNHVRIDWRKDQSRRLVPQNYNS